MATHKSNGKVFINPNFTKYHKNHSHPNTSMYINPNFNRQLNPSILHQVPNSKKIFVNPNFIKQTIPSVLPRINQDVPFIRVNENHSQNTETVNITSDTQSTTLTSTPVSKSRYHIVRRNRTKIPSDDTKTTINKIKVNKYKIITANATKQSSDLARSNQLLATPSTSKSSSYYKQSVKKNTDNVYSIRPLNITKRKISSTPTRSKKPMRMTKNKVTPRSLKKNNIPCPQFRKYGKCLRKIQGNCEFLHDRKHVTICRKFLKGICHNSNCLLSHDLTDKKMPTCYFYLNGMCTKDGCPYLHIKLNEKAKVCVDFLKGYCEMGDKCLKRHVNICPELNQKGICSKKICPYPHTKLSGINDYPKINKNKKLVQLNKEKKKMKNVEEIHNIPNAIEKVITDCRYYTVEQSTETSTSEIVLKPSRCKLGTLPSFIQL